MKKEKSTESVLALSVERRRIHAGAPYAKHPKTDTVDIERLIDRVKQGKLEQSDTQLIEKVLRLFLNLMHLVNAKI